MQKTDNKIAEIRKYYQEKASTKKYATSPDTNLREVEIEYISQWLDEGKSILDVGCGNGYSTICFAEKFCSRFVGIDFVPEMIESANILKDEYRLKGDIRFDIGDVTSLAFVEQTFDIVISERCLLNLPTRDDQWQAMKEIARVLKPGGIYLMLEGTNDGLRKLNDIRSQFGLEAIPDADPKYNWFSNKFDEKELFEKGKQYFNNLETVQRFGMYYFISRVIHPLLVAPNMPVYDAPINELARHISSKIPNFEDIGHVALFVFRK